MNLIAICVISITTFGFAFIAAATNGNDEHSVMKEDMGGKVSQKKFIRHSQWMFEKNDANKDGLLDKLEMQKLHKILKSMHKNSVAH